ncbi:MAG: hypothetical protein EOP80_21680, partial [Variovorax sp.]
MSNQPLKTPYDHPSAWKGVDMKSSTEWIFALDDSDNDELQAALLAARSTEKSVIDLREADFPLPTLGPRLKAMRDEVMNGRGFSLVRGFDIARYDARDAALIYWCMGAYIGSHGAHAPVDQRRV